MLKANIFIADPKMAGLLRSFADDSNEFEIGSVIELAGTGYQFRQTLRETPPDVMLLEMSQLDRDVQQAAAIHAQFPNVPLVGLASRDFWSLVASSPVRDLISFVVWPFTVAELEQAISIAVHKMYGGIQENLVAFLPGKAGSGASTVVFHTALVMGQVLKRRVLVMEGDLHSGLLSAMLHVEPKFPIRAVLAEAPRIDDLNWPRYVTPADGVDFLLADPTIKEPVPSWAHYYQILRFAAPKYDLVMVDLPEVVNPATAEIVRRARAVHVVCTPEFASLKLSLQRCQELASWGVERGRIQVLLNRAHKTAIDPKEAERILDCPVAMTFPNDYKRVSRATMDASLIDKRSDLGEAFLAFSRMLAGTEAEKGPLRKLFWK